MPGDSAGDSVEIKNTTDRDTELFFFAGYENQTETQIELLKALEIQISLNGREIYKGKLTQEGMEKGISLGKFAPGAGGTMDFTVTMPENLGNAYARRNADVKWVFAALEAEATPTPGPANTGVSPDGGSSYASSGPAGGKSAPEGSTVSAPIKTGDDTPLRALAVLFLFSALLIVVLYLAKRRMDHEK